MADSLGPERAATADPGCGGRGAEIWAGRRNLLPPHRGKHDRRNQRVCVPGSCGWHGSAEGAGSTGSACGRRFARRQVARSLGSASGQRLPRFPGLPAGRRTFGSPSAVCSLSAGRWMAAPRTLLPRVGLTCFRCHRARLYHESQQEDFIPSRKSPACPARAGSTKWEWCPALLQRFTRSIAAPPSGTCIASRFHDSRGAPATLYPRLKANGPGLAYITGVTVQRGTESVTCGDGRETFTALRVGRFYPGASSVAILRGSRYNKRRPDRSCRTGISAGKCSRRFHHQGTIYQQVSFGPEGPEK